jgi:hypothetical protein
MAGDGGLSAYEKQPAIQNTPTVDTLLCGGRRFARPDRGTGALVHSADLEPALGVTRNSWNLRITVGKLAASILAPRPTSRAIDPATKDCSARRKSEYLQFPSSWPSISLRGCSLRVFPSLALPTSYRATFNVEGRTFEMHREFVTHIDSQICQPRLKSRLT